LDHVHKNNLDNVMVLDEFLELMMRVALNYATVRRAASVCTGAGGDHGIATMSQSRREISDISSHYL
jgi:hypothetical protein